MIYTPKFKIIQALYFKNLYFSSKDNSHNTQQSQQRNFFSSLSSIFQYSFSVEGLISTHEIDPLGRSNFQNLKTKHHSLKNQRYSSFQVQYKYLNNIDLNNFTHLYTMHVLRLYDFVSFVSFFIQNVLHFRRLVQTFFKFV